AVRRRLAGGEGRPFPTLGRRRQTSIVNYAALLYYAVGLLRHRTERQDVESDLARRDGDARRRSPSARNSGGGRAVPGESTGSAFEQADPEGNSACPLAIEGENPMSYTTLDPDETLVLFADLQSGIIELTATNDLAHLRRAVGALAKLAALFDIPAIVTTAPADGDARVTPEIAAALGELPRQVRTTTDAFTHGPTRDAIVGTGRKTLLIAGVATEVIVQHTALSGAALGLQVQVVVDASGGPAPRPQTAPPRGLAHG